MLLADALMPPHCHCCGAPLEPGETAVCATCLTLLPRTGYHRIADNPVEQKFGGFFPFERATGFLAYSPGGTAARLIQDFKYHKYPSLAIKLGEEMGRELMVTGFFGDADTVIPVPIHWRKKAQRGYNQAEMLARGVARAVGMKVDTSLKAVKPHKSQTKMDHAQRAANTLGIFSVSRPERLEGRHVVLVDDVCTTGATLRSAAMTLLAAYPDPAKAPRITLLALCATQ